MKLSVLMASYNRRDLTVQCIVRAQAAAAVAGAEISFTLFDDGSSDGTVEVLSTFGPSVKILRGDGSAYWARSMALAEADVLASSSDDTEHHLVWLNDDVTLDANAFLLLSETVTAHPRSVVVGATRDPQSSEITYSGMRKAGLHPLKFDLVAPTAHAQRVETFNGNLVIVPIAVARDMGGIDGGFSHALADIDYGLRCHRANVPVILAPFSYGTCSRNMPMLPGRIRQDWAKFIGPKGGGNYSSLRRILVKSNSRSWPVIIASTYGLWWLRRMSMKLRRELTS